MSGTGRSLSLFAATVPSYLQILRAVHGLLGKAEAFCAARGIDPDDLIQARLAPDMRPFAYQVRETVTHSVGAIRALHSGVFSPERSAPPDTFPTLATCIGEALAALESLDATALEACIGREVRFVTQTREVPFSAQNFLLSFSQPNFYFHATTAYDILRWRGMPIGKADFVGRQRSGVAPTRA